jgi:WD40 repeat protein
MADVGESDIIAGMPAETASRFWNASNGQPIDSITTDADSLLSVAWSADGARLASASRDGTILVWNARTDTIIKTIHTGDAPGVWSLSWSPNGRELACSSRSDIQIWNADT